MAGIDRRRSAPPSAAGGERFERLARAGIDVHSEASFVMGFGPSTVLDAGCGTGRVSIELDRRGVAVAGIDNDLAALKEAQRAAPRIEWLQGDICDFRLPGADGGARRFDLVLTAGNVMVVLDGGKDAGKEAAAVLCLAEHVAPGGLLVTGFQLLRGRYGFEEYERDCEAAGLEHVARYSSWNRDRFGPGSGYLVAVHRAPGGDAEATGRDPVVASEAVVTEPLS
jgi:SAM-dependent methyltransferase